MNGFRKNMIIETQETGIEGIEQGVILQAVYDYRYCICRLKAIEGKNSKWYNTDRVAKTNLLEKTKAYFASDDFEYIAGINGLWLMNKLDEQLEKCHYNMKEVLEDCFPTEG